MIEIENVSLTIGKAAILKDVSLSIPPGGVTALIGPNGAGKSTLLSLIARLRPLQAGRISVGGLAVNATPSAEIAKRLAILRQDHGLASRLRVRELVGFGRYPHCLGQPTPRDREITDEAIAEFGLGDLADRFVETLSGGQRQRALLAMAFCQATDCLLLDEPLNNLDMFHARELMRKVRLVAERDRRTVVVVLHDVNYAAAYSDRIVAMRDGRVVADGPPSATLTTETLDAVFGYDMRVQAAEGRPLVLHHL